MKTQHNKYSLTADIAASILDYEMRLDSSPSINSVHALLDLYSTAIELYAMHKDNRYLDMQDRMHKMLRRTEVFRIIQIHNGCALPLENLGTFTHSETTQKKSEVFVKSHSNSYKKVSAWANNDMKSQEYSLVRKLQVRKQTRLAKTMTLSFEDSTFSEKTFELDLSEICEKKSNSSRTFEDRVEEIMEQFYSEKASRVSEVRIKYEPQLREMKNFGSLGEAIRNTMLAQMQTEIDKINHDIDTRRKAALTHCKLTL